ncbi:MAG: alanine racemase [Elusimicrobia bacterium]|nr:alanine racemase [Elusimicrobiota bacterium]
MLKWIEIDSSIIASNVRIIKNSLKKGVKLMAVVKAGGYGHGALTTARTAVKNGASFLGVLTVDEALELRKSGIKTDIMTLSPCLKEELKKAAENSVIPTIDDIRLLKEAENKKIKLSFNLDCDTGLKRWGIDPSMLNDFLKRAKDSEYARLFSFSTHIAYTPYRNMTDAREKLSLFGKLSEEVKKFFPKALVHAANSLILCDFPEFQFDMVRAGNLIYGIYPSDIYAKKKGGTPLKGIKRPWRFFAKIISIKKVKAGEVFGYAGEITAYRDMVLASIPVGYSDGLSMEPRDNVYKISEGASYWAEIKGRRAPFVSKASICNTILDITDIPGVKTGDIVSLAIRRTAANANMARIERGRS